MLKVTREVGSRVLKFTDGEESLDVLVNYTGNGNVGMGIFLDNKVIPAIMKGLESKNLADKINDVVIDLNAIHKKCNDPATEIILEGALSDLKRIKIVLDRIGVIRN